MVLYKKFDLFDYDRSSLLDYYYQNNHDVVCQQNWVAEADPPFSSKHRISQLSVDMYSKFKNFYNFLLSFERNLKEKTDLDLKPLVKFHTVYPESLGMLHIDRIPITGGPVYWSINFPINGESNSKIVWYDVGSDRGQDISKKWSIINFNREKEYNVIEELYLDTPTLIDPSVPHQIENFGADYRVTLVIRSGNPLVQQLPLNTVWEVLSCR
jgi:hypothetical protein